MSVVTMGCSCTRVSRCRPRNNVRGRWGVGAAACVGAATGDGAISVDWSASMTSWICGKATELFNLLNFA